MGAFLFWGYGVMGNIEICLISATGSSPVIPAIFFVDGSHSGRVQQAVNLPEFLSLIVGSNPTPSAILHRSF
jgi:hypothetical protein